MNKKGCVVMKYLTGLLGLLLLSAGFGVSATEVEYRRPSNGEGLYQESNVDLRVKVLGGEILLRREVTGLKWEFNRAWADLGMSDRVDGSRYLPISQVQKQVDAGALTAVDGSFIAWLPRKIYRNGYLYTLRSNSSPSVWEGDEGRTIALAENGYRWQDRSGEWIEYDQYGRMTRFGNLTGLLGRVTRNGNNQIEKVYDRKDNLVMSFGYDGAARLSTVTDRAERRISYQWSGTQLTSVVDALGGEWHYDYQTVEVPYFLSWPEISYNGIFADGGYSFPKVGKQSFVVIKQITDPESRVTKLENYVHGGLYLRQCKQVGSTTSWRLVEKVDADTGVRTVTREPIYHNGYQICEYLYTPLQVVLRAITDSDNQRTEFATAYDGSQETYSSRIQYADGSQLEGILGTDGRPEAIYRGGELVYTRAKQDRREVMVDSAGNKAETQFDEWDNPVRIDLPDGTAITYTWHGRYNLPLTITNQLGVVTEFRYNNNGQLIDRIEAKGLPEQRITHMEYNAEGMIETMTLTGEGVNYRLDYQYDEYGNITELTRDNAFARQLSEYTVTGQPRIMVDESKATWHYSYNAEGLPQAVTDPLNHTLALVYGRSNNPQAFIDGKGQKWSIAYNAQDRIKALTNPYGDVRYTSYNSSGDPTSLKDELGHTSQFIYDKAGRLQKILDGVGNITRYQYGYDSVNRNGAFDLLREMTTPTYKEQYQYDSRHRMTARTRLIEGNEFTDGYQYDKAGRLVGIQDANGRAIRIERNAYGKVTVFDEAGAVSHTRYDAQGNVTGFTDAAGGEWRFAYDGRGLMKSMTRPGFGTWQYVYTPTGKRAWVIDARGQQQSFEYDAAGRMTVRRFFTNSEEAQQPEKALKTISYGYDANNRLTSWDDGDIKGSLAYDDAGRFLGETINYGTFSRGYRYDYYANGLKKSLTTNDGTVIGYEYDAGNKLTKVSLPGVGSVSINDYNWLAPTQIQYPGGGKKSIAYTGLLEPKTMAVSDINGKSVATLGYEYGKAREILSSSKDGLTTDYGYNQRYALTSAKESQADGNGQAQAGREFNYQLDANANRIAENDDSDWQYQDGKLLKAKGHSYEYDANGNQIKERYELAGKPMLREFGYDGDNRLLWVKENGAVLARYGYDPFGRRLSKEVNGKTTYFVYSSEGVLAELDSEGNEQVGYGFRPQGIWGTNPLYIKVAGKYYYYQNDHLGTPYRIVDGTGFIVWSTLQDPFGKMAVAPGSTLTNHLRFPGQYYDAETGLHYNWQRYYQPDTGRYISPDPISLKGGTNAYGYVKGQVTRLYDALGLVGRTDYNPDDQKNNGDIACMGTAFNLLGSGKLSINQLLVKFHADISSSCDDVSNGDYGGGGLSKQLSHMYNDNEAEGPSFVTHPAYGDGVDFSCDEFAKTSSLIIVLTAPGSSGSFDFIFESKYSNGTTKWCGKNGSNKPDCHDTLEEMLENRKNGHKDGSNVTDDFQFPTVCAVVCIDYKPHKK